MELQQDTDSAAANEVSQRLLSRAASVYATVFATTKIEDVPAAAVVFHADGSDQLVALTDCGNPACYAEQIRERAFEPAMSIGVALFFPDALALGDDLQQESVISLYVHVESGVAAPIDLVMPNFAQLRAVMGKPAFRFEEDEEFCPFFGCSLLEKLRHGAPDMVCTGLSSEGTAGATLCLPERTRLH